MYTPETLPRPFSFHVPVDGTMIDWTVAVHTIGHYTPGMSYTVRSGDAYNDLAAKVCEWLEQGLILPGRLDPASVSGG